MLETARSTDGGKTWTPSWIPQNASWKVASNAMNGSVPGFQNLVTGGGPPFSSPSLASAIGTPELLRIGQLVAVETFRPVETLTIVAILYFAVTYPVALLVDRLERRFKVARA